MNYKSSGKSMSYKSAGINKMLEQFRKMEGDEVNKKKRCPECKGKPADCKCYDDEEFMEREAYHSIPVTGDN